MLARQKFTLGQTIVLTNPACFLEPRAYIQPATAVLFRSFLIIQARTRLSLMIHCCWFREPVLASWGNIEAADPIPMQEDLSIYQEPD